MVNEPTIQDLTAELSKELASGITKAVKTNRGISAEEEALLALRYKEIIDKRQNKMKLRNFKVPAASLPIE